MPKDNGYDRTAAVIKTIVSLMVIFAIFLVVKQTIVDEQAIEKMIGSAGIFGPIVLILLTVMGILFSPIPSIIFIILAGYLYGAWFGALYSYIGHLLAALLAYSTAWRFKKLWGIDNGGGKYKRFIDRHKKFLYLLFMIPLIPISVLSIVSASSGIALKRFMKMVLISFLPAVLFFSFFGDMLSYKSVITLGLWSALIVVLVIIIFSLFRMKNGGEKV